MDCVDYVEMSWVEIRLFQKQDVVTQYLRYLQIVSNFFAVRLGDVWVMPTIRCFSIDTASLGRSS